MSKFNKRRKIKINKENKQEFNFKEVALTKMAKRQLLVTLLSILGVTVISLGSAYAVFTSISKSADYNVIKVGTLNIDFGEDSSNVINLSKQYPMSDEEGMKLKPYTFTIKNTGSLAADYEVFIQDDQDMISQDNCTNNQLNKDYIKYKLDTGSPTILSSIAGSDYRIASGTLGAGGSVTYTLFVWIREGVGNDVLNKHYHGKIIVNGVNSSNLPVADTLLANIGENGAINTSDPDQTFITGTDPNNYIWYSGKLWRAVSIDTSDNSVKLVTQLSIGSISYNENGNSSFEGSYIEQWLNDVSVDGFLGNLRDPESFIKMDSQWNATMMSNGNSKPPKTTIVEDAVGLLNAYEFRMSYLGTTAANGYLNNGHNWWTLTPASSSNILMVFAGSGSSGMSSTISYGIRPSINLKSNVKIVDGDGTVNNPYRLDGDYDTNLSGTLLNTRYSGEFLTFGIGENTLYQIVSHETEGLTKIVSYDMLKRDSSSYYTTTFGSSPVFSTNSTIGTFLNGIYLSDYVGSEYTDLIEDNTAWYIGNVEDGESYKLAKYTNATDNILTSNIVTSKVGLLRYGELMPSQITSSYWLLTLSTASSKVRYISNTFNGFDYSPSGARIGVRPAMNLKSNVVITGGTGTKNDPFTLALQ